MSRQRFIHPSIWTSEQVMGLSRDARLLFIGIFSTADDHGKRKASAISLKVEIYPADAIAVSDITKWRDEIAAIGLIRVYADNEGTEILDIPSWIKYQKPKYTAPSRFQDYPGSGVITSTPSPYPDQTFPISGEDVPHIRPSGVVWCGVEKSGVVGSGEERKETAPPNPPGGSSEPTKASAQSRTRKASAPVPVPEDLKSLRLYAEDPKLCGSWDDLMDSWQEAHPHMDIMEQIRRAHAWEIANPAKRKKLRGKFLSSWLDRAHDDWRVKKNQVPEKLDPDDDPMNWPIVNAEEKL